VGKSGYNPYALSHYCRAAKDIEQSMLAAESVIDDHEERPVRHWVLMSLCGRVADVALRAIGEPPATKEERVKYGW